MNSFSVPFFMHSLGKEELVSLSQTLKGPILTTGEATASFEKQFSSYLGRRYSLGLSSCTAALQLSLEALGIGPGDEVITTPMTFVATALAILQAGAKPVFADIDSATGNIDPEKVIKVITKKTKAIIPVHLYGVMCDMRALNKIARKYGLKIVEDAAHCVEGSREGIRPGQLSQTACFSFYATKNLTCGEGGAVVTDDPVLYEKLKLLSHHGMDKKAADRHSRGYRHWDVTAFGWKYNMDNIQASLLIPQLKKIRAVSKRREGIWKKYARLFSDLPGVRLPEIPPDTIHARHLFVVRVDREKRDRVIKDLQKAGISVMVNYRPVHLLTYFRKKFGYKRGDFPVAEKMGDEVISLPFYPLMPDRHVGRVAETLIRSAQR